uniref:Pyruvate carboxylase n=2 Tax=Leptocylindrus danicus TaxID=163516 RepID=A0A7S2KAA7_9STRA
MSSSRWLSQHLRLQIARRSFSSNAEVPPFQKLLAANRGEIATRICRAGAELKIPTICAIYSQQDRLQQHRYKADQAFSLNPDLSPVGQYLDIPGIVEICKKNGVDGVHPGYGFLSENANFANSLESAGIKFIGPTVENLSVFGDKTQARQTAERLNVPVVPGSANAVASVKEARDYIQTIGYPVIVKAAMGGGGRGMRVVTREEDLEQLFTTASNEAYNAFGDGRMFIERFVANPRHIEVQCIGDGTGDVIHLYDRDCSVQRRHQKVIETAPALDLPPATRKSMLDDAVRLLSDVKYKNAGTVEFLVDTEGRHYFIEVNPRIQVEHTVTEEVTGVDLVQTQIKIASGQTLKSLGLTQDSISVNGYAMQCRVTTEDPADDFRPDTGTIDVFRMPAGMGIRLDDGPGFPGAKITPHYDSLLVKITAKARERSEAIKKIVRALKEFRVRGVTTNKSFLLNVLQHDDFINKPVTTKFIEDHPDVLSPIISQDRAQKLLHFLGNVIVNGPEDKGVQQGVDSPHTTVEPPTFSPSNDAKPTLRSIYVNEGPEAFAKAVRDHEGLLVMDTTWRDAHQSLLATRLRTYDILKVAKATNIGLRNAYSLENWGGATFDVCMRFLRECPWDRLEQMREQVPDIPFQMLLRGANAVGYTSYPDNLVHEFCKTAVNHGMDVFRVFDSLNYLENMRLGIDAVGEAGGIIEGTVCFTSNLSSPRYNLEYYVDFVQKLVDCGIHVLAIKDMAGLLTPGDAKKLIGTLRQEFPTLPIHLHTHDTAGTGIATYLAAYEAGADVVDCAIDSMSGTTSQPSLGALMHSVPDNLSLNTGHVHELNSYWEETRKLYAPFESGQKSGSADVYVHEMPGGQYTNLMFQSGQLGLASQWSDVKKAYADANELLGDIVKVTPSSKVCGDLAQFMVANGLSKEDVLEQADTLSFPNSVIEYFQGYLGIPPHGFPEPLRTRITQNKPVFEGRPGAEMDAYDFPAKEQMLKEKWSNAAGHPVRDVDVLSHAMYPAVFEDFMLKTNEFGKVSMLDTPTFLTGMKIGEELAIQLETGKSLIVKLLGVGVPNEDGIVDVNFELNGQSRIAHIKDLSVSSTVKERQRALIDVAGSVGAPMPGVVVETKVKKGDKVNAGDPLVLLSAMKMETVVSAPCSGKVLNVEVTSGDQVNAGDLVVEIEEEYDHQEVA